VEASAVGGGLQASTPLRPASSLAAGWPAQQTPPPSSDFTPVTTTPDGEPITEELLTQLKREGNEEAIRQLMATNGQCAPL